ncbi:hypothetical protein HY643_02980 [Candidatus Woesearchaeota archaeon]|nr:hypothetical protein [Candidatus Woesearchaeota archaeon]
MAKCKTSQSAINKSKRNLAKLVTDYVSYLNEARTPSRAVGVTARILEANGFLKFNAEKYGSDPSYVKSLLNAKGVYFVDRNKINVAAVKFGKENISQGVNIAGAHVDFCTLTNKVNSIKGKVDGVYLDTRPYGGFYPHQWMDRPLTIIGETLVKAKESKRELVEWSMPGHIPEPSIHNPKGYSEKSYKEAFQLEELDIFTGYKDAKSFLKALNEARKCGPVVKRADFDSGFNQFHAVPAEPTQLIGDYVVGYGHDDRSCMFSALRAILAIAQPKYTSLILGVAREEIGSAGVGGARDVFLDNIINILCDLQGLKDRASNVYTKSVMLSADVDIAFSPQNMGVNDKENCAQFGKGASLVIANGSSGNPTGNVVMPNDLYFIEQFLNKRDLAYQVTALPSKVGIGGGGGTIAEYYSERGILTADIGVPVANMHGTLSRIFSPDLDSTVEAFIALFQREEKRILWG